MEAARQDLMDRIMLTRRGLMAETDAIRVSHLLTSLHG